MNSAPLIRPFPARIWSHIRTAGFLVVAGLGAWQNLAGVRVADGRGGDSTSQVERRFEALRAGITAHVKPPDGQIGYLNDVVDSDDGYHYAVQYALAPLLCVPGPPYPLNLLDPALRGLWRAPPDPVATPRWFIGDFHAAANAQPILQQRGLVVERDFGAGVMLLRRGPQ